MIAAAPATPARTSSVISTVVSGPSWRPPLPFRPTAAISAANATVLSAAVPTRGSAMRRASARGSSGAACADTVPARDAGQREQAGAEGGEEDDQRGRERLAVARQRSDGTGREELAADPHGLAAVALRLLDALALVGRGGVEQRAAALAAVAGRQLGGRAGAAAGAGAATAATAATAAGRGAGAAARVAGGGVRALAVERRQARAVDDVAAGGVLVAVGRELLERLAVCRLRVRAVDLLVAAGVDEQVGRVVGGQ